MKDKTKKEKTAVVFNIGEVEFLTDKDEHTLWEAMTETREEMKEIMIAVGEILDKPLPFTAQMKEIGERYEGMQLFIAIYSVGVLFGCAKTEQVIFDNILQLFRGL